MENNRPKKKNAGLTALIALLLVVTTIASCIGIYAWAKYTKSQNGSATAQVAKWSFNVRLKKGDSSVSLASEAIDLSTTIDHVANGKIAPGTSGTFDIEIDTTGTEVDMQYEVTISLANCPRNITFSRKTGEDQGQDQFTTISAGGASNSQDLTRTGITFSEYVTKGNNGVHVERIKWDWPYSDVNDADYDARDNEDEDIINASQSKKVTMNITVTGTEKLGEPVDPNSVQGQAQAGNIHIGDIVNYDPGTTSTASINLPEGASIEETKIAAISLPSGASLDQTINADSAPVWAVLDVDQTTGTVKIIPLAYSSVKLKLSGKDGYNNAIQAIDAVASIYKNDLYAEDSKGLTVEDVNKLENYTPNGEVGEYSTVHSSNLAMDNDFNIVENGTHKETTTEQVWVATETAANSPAHYENREVETTVYDSATFKSTPTMGWYSYEASTLETIMNENDLFFWLASRCLRIYYKGGGFHDFDGCGFQVRILRSRLR